MYLVKETSPEGYINWRLLYPFQMKEITGVSVVVGGSYTTDKGVYMIVQEV